MPTLDRQRALAREKLKRQMARRAAAAKRRRQLQAGAVAALVIVVVLGGIATLVYNLRGDDKKDTASPAPSPGASASPAAPGTCNYSKSSGGQVKNVGTPPAKDVVHTGTKTVNVKTSAGDMTFELDLAKAPCTANSFAYLAGKKYFDGTSCHRLTTKGIFVLQCGDPSGTGRGGPGYRFEDEFAGNPNTHERGVISMANAGPGTNGSQFFIVYKNDSGLESKYTIFGTVTKGIENVEKVAAAGVKSGDGDGPPKTPVKFESVTVAGS